MILNYFIFQIHTFKYRESFLLLKFMFSWDIIIRHMSIN